MQQLRARFGGTTALQSFLYADHHPVAQAQGTHSVSLLELELTGTVPVYGEPIYTGGGDGGNNNGPIDREQTARRIAELHYAGFGNLSPDAKERVVAYVQSQLPSNIAAGTELRLNAFLVVANAGMSATTQITDYSVRQIGTDDNLPAGSPYISPINNENYFAFIGSGRRSSNNCPTGTTQHQP